MDVFVKFHIISCAVLVASIVSGIVQYVFYKQKKIQPHHILIGGTALASILWYWPIYSNAGEDLEYICPFVSSFLATVKIFAADGIKNAVIDCGVDIPDFYKTVGVILSCWAPILTFTFILFLFRSAVTRMRYFFSRRKTYVFSELNDTSLAIAKSIREREGVFGCTIAFADIIDKNEEKHLDLVDGAKQVNAILFRNDLEAIKWAPKRPTRRRISFFLISSDEAEKIRHTKDIVRRFNNAKHSLFIFGNGEESRLLLKSYADKCDEMHIKITRIDDIKLLTYSYLYNHGHELFRDAPKNGEIKTVNAVIIGFGKYGVEMFKSLLWYCQMPGYKVNITILDHNEKTRSRFEAAFPEVELGKDFTDAKDMRYRVDIVSSAFGENVFTDHIKALPEKTDFFVFLGDDNKNVLAINAIKNARYPQYTETDTITTVIYNPDVKDLMPKDIRVLDVLDSFYCSHDFAVNKFIDDGLKEHSLFWYNQVNIVSVGFSARERAAFDRIFKYCNDRNYKITPVIFGKYKNDKKAVAERFNDSKVALQPFDLQKLKEYAETSESFVIWLDSEGTTVYDAFTESLHVSGEKNQDKRKKQKAKKRILLTSSADRRVDSYLEKRDSARLESVRNAYHLSDYNFYSSLSKALHRKLRSYVFENYSEPYRTVLGITSTTETAADYKDKVIERLENAKEKESAERELHTVAEIEHVRWNAYLRSEGYVNRNVKNIDYKTHNKIIPVSDELTVKDRLKDV